MDILEGLAARHCCRAFLPQVPERALVEKALAAAAMAPSSKNTQPWMAHFALGEKVEPIRQALCAAFDAGEKIAPELRYSPAELPEEQMARARACGFSLFAHKGIARDDKPARRAHERLNFELFDAPGFFVLTVPAVHEKGTFVDLGNFYGQLLQALRAVGYEATPMVSVTMYPTALRAGLPIPEGRVIVCAAAFGVEDPAASVNAFRTVREPLEALATWA